METRIACQRRPRSRRPAKFPVVQTGKINQRAGAWSDWRDLPLADPFSPAVLAEMLDGGQAFRWRRETDGSWHGTWGGHSARVRPGPGGRLQWSAPAALAPAAA